MRILSALVAAMLAASTYAQAQTDQAHSAHHPASAAAASSPMKAKAPPRKVAPAASAPTTAQMDAQMRSMRDMHEKMMSARTPEERQTLMADHMKAMQDAMAMMDRMQSGSGSGGDMPMRHEMMGKRMDMMQMMMEMMMDREANETPSTR